MRKSGKVDLLMSVARWFDSEAGIEHYVHDARKGVDWPRIIPFLVLHAACLGAFWTGWSTTALVVALLLYLVRMFAITGFYHRYFSHRSYKTDRSWQFIFAVLGNSSVQRGPLWWAAHHRHHHRYADQEQDIHSPSRHGFFYSHMGWLTTRENFPTKTEYVGDWVQYPELVWLNRFDTIVPVMLAAALYGLGQFLEIVAPSLGTSGPQMLVWGFFVSTVLLFHGTSTINSLDHMIGSRRYDTPDTSRNNAVLALITLGEGWHNNHHHYAISARQGFFWWELDITYCLLRLLERMGIVRDLRPVPDAIRRTDLVLDSPRQTH